ncbi:MAG: nuclease-like protein [Ramlibacter sp.]|nr:nuclease-like protein [Ramlibacter sp.]
MNRLCLLLAACLLLVSGAHAAILRGTVAYVGDGDTLYLRPAGGGRQVAIRLLDIDAPEGCQPYGPQARQALARRVLRQPVRALTHGQDDYGRTLAHVKHRGEDVGAWLVRDGHAWSTGFRRKAGPYADLEAQARRSRSGLWALPAPMEPRTFRKRFGRCH